LLIIDKVKEKFFVMIFIKGRLPDYNIEL